MEYINLSTASLASIYRDIRTYAWYNNILASTAGFSIGYATKELIEKTVQRTVFSYWEPSSFVGDMLLWIAVLIGTLIVAYIIQQYVIPPPSTEETAKSLASLQEKGKGVATEAKESKKEIDKMSDRTVAISRKKRVGPMPGNGEETDNDEDNHNYLG